MSYQWPQSESFISAYSCRFLPKNGKSQFSNVFFSPVYNLLDLSRPSVWAFSWALMIMAWYLLTYVLPIGKWNSVDGEYIDTNRIYLFTFILYYIMTVIFISFLSTRGCTMLEDQARDYLYSPMPPIPFTLETSR